MDTSTTTRAVARSAAAWDAAADLMPGGFMPAHPRLGTSGDADFGSIGGRDVDQPGAPPFPVVAKGKGAILTDVDGNDYIDFCGGNGALILGYADERVVAAISKASSKGFGFCAPSEAELRLAELIAGRLASVDMLRLVNTPVEALSGAMALARRYTGRDHVVFVGARYGCYDLTEPASMLPVVDVDALGSELRERASTVAAVIVDPLSVTGGGFSGNCVPAPAGTPQLPALRSLCEEHGAVLIFDETLAGLRVAAGSIGDALEANPHLTLLGPIVGGGLSLAAYGGQRDVMSAEKKPDQTTQATVRAPANDPTLETRLSLLAVAAGMATLQAVAEPGFYEALDSLSARFEAGLASAAENAFPEGNRVHVKRMANVLSVCFESSTAEERASARNTSIGSHDTGPRRAGHRTGPQPDFLTYARFHQEMLDRGVLLPWHPSIPLFISAAHTTIDVDRAIDAACAAFGTLATPI